MLNHYSAKLYLGKYPTPKNSIFFISAHLIIDGIWVVSFLLDDSIYIASNDILEMIRNR